MIRLCNHIARHIPYTLVYDFRHGSHDPFRLCTVESFAFQPLNKMVGIKVEFGSKRSGMEGSMLSLQWQ